MNLIAISPGPINPYMRPGYYLRHVGYGIEVIVVGPMPNTPEDFEIELARRFGTRYEITHAAGVGAPDGVDESQFYRRGFWRMSFYPSNRIPRGDVPETSTEARPPRRRRQATAAEDSADVLTARRIDWSTEPDPHGGTPRLHTTMQRVIVETLERAQNLGPMPMTRAALMELARQYAARVDSMGMTIPPMTAMDRELFDARVRVIRQEMAEPSHTVRVISRVDEVPRAIERAFQRLDRVRGGNGAEVVGAPEDVRRFRSPTGD